MIFGTGTLRSGSTGDAVTELQRWLMERGFLIAYAAPTGTFDQTTEYAVRAFQYSAGIGADGQVGDGTRTAAESFTGTATSTGWHPYAERDVRQNTSGGSFTTDTRRGILHTTEEPYDRLPDYTSPPHFTVGRNGAGQPAQMWQHYPVTVAAKSLRVSETVQTNRYGAIQIEIIGRAALSPTLATDDPELFRCLGELMRWIEAATGVSRVANYAFDGEAGAWGLKGSVRLDDAGWLASAGWLGHQHAPAPNDHWDPGIIDIAALLAVGPFAQPAPPTLHGTGIGLSAGPDGTGPHPWIRATTRELTNAFPSLTFAVGPAGLPYFEVVLTTDQTLFAPDQGGRRTPENFYAGRQDGLRAASQAQGRYVAPVQVIRAFAEASPGGGQVYYTVIGYTDPLGGGAAPAADPAALARTAPSVTMVPGFVGHTMTESLGVPLGLLRTPTRAAAAGRRGTAARPAAGRSAPVRSAPVRSSALRRAAPPRAATGSGWGPAARAPGGPARAAGPAVRGQTGAVARAAGDAGADRGEGEDGYDYRMSSASPVPDIPPDLRPAPSPSFTGAPAGEPPATRAPAAGAPAAPEPAAGPVGQAPTGQAPPAFQSATPGEPYDDGWGAWTAPTALDSRFGARQPQPRPLVGVESPQCDTDDEYDDLGWAGTAYSDAPGPAAPVPPGDPADWRPPMPQLTPAQKRDVVEAFVGPDRELYAAVDPDGAFAGRAGTDHPAYQRYHLGLSYGLAGFTQDLGPLGHLLLLMRQRERDGFDAIFGPAADELLSVTNSPGPLARDTPDGRSARVQPVDGADLWEEPWLSRFVAAGAELAFQGAQIELAAGLYLDPIVRFAADLGLATERGLAMIFDRVAHRGVPGGLAWVIETVGAVPTPQLLQAALAGLGFTDVESFQRSQPDLLPDDQFGPFTHAALTGALRGRPDLAGGAPVPVLGYPQMLDALAQRATGQAWGDRMVRLRRDEGITDELPVGDLVG